MSLTRTGSFDPFRRAMNDVFDSMECDIMAPMGMGSSLPIGILKIPSHKITSSPGGFKGDLGMNLDFHETSKGFELNADLPGMKKEDITVDVDRDSGVLTVTGERKQEREKTSEGAEGERNYHFVERSYGKTTRSIRLPDTADVSKASAAYVDGVLKLNFPKMDPPAARRLQIPVGDGE